jgi:hypothetical protein
MNVLGIQFCAETGEAAKVGKQHCDLTPVADRNRRSACIAVWFCEWLAAMTAELRPRAVGEITEPTNGWKRRAAFGTELKSPLIGSLAVRAVHLHFAFPPRILTKILGRERGLSND